MKTLTQEEKYERLVNDLALSLSRYNSRTSDIVHQISEILENNRPNKSKRFAKVRFLKDCGLV
jgi:hypothetical protein